MGLLDMFVEIKPKAKTTPTPSPQMNTIPNNYYDNASNSVPQSTPSGNFNPEGVQKKMDFFRDLLNEANLPGPDLKEFIDSINELNDMPGDQKYTMVWKILCKNGLTWDKIEKSYTVYLQKIEESAKSFQELIKSSESSEVIGGRARIEEIIKQKEQYQQQLQKLDEESRVLAIKVGEAESKLAQNTKDFDYAKSQYTHLLTETYEKIKTIKQQ